MGEGRGLVQNGSVRPSPNWGLSESPNGSVPTYFRLVVGGWGEGESSEMGQ